MSGKKDPLRLPATQVDRAVPGASGKAGPKPEAAGVAGDDARETDGRRLRSSASRERIRDAMLRLVREGHVSPGAARVAELAGVGLRTVFRHFDDMESLYREMAESIQARVLPAFFRPYRSDDWRGRLDELVERRIDLYEAILPYKVAGDAMRFHSPYMMQDYAAHLQLEKISLESVLPRDLADDEVLVRALRAATGFQGWRILRRDLDLGVEEARAVTTRTVDALLATSATKAGARPKATKGKR